MLIVNVVEILAAALVSLVGESHLDLSFFLLQCKCVHNRFGRDSRLKVFYFFGSSCFLLDFHRFFALNFGSSFEWFLFFCHGRFI
jgi:hypothetical protein